MVTKVITLDEADPEAYAEFKAVQRSQYLDGECYAFAIALHEGLGWPLIGLIREDGPVPEEIWHAGVRTPEGKLLDVRGALGPIEFTQHFLPGRFHVIGITPQQLREVRPVPEYSVQAARVAAELLFSSLPWKDPLLERIKAFGDRLEEISHELGISIRAMLPAQPPIAYASYGDETGYTFRQAPNGQGFTFDRRFD